jgi:hypothetical protein
MSLTLEAPTEAPAPDCVHWELAALDLEPETCWCLGCGDELACSAYRLQRVAQDLEQQLYAEVVRFSTEAELSDGPITRRA